MAACILRAQAAAVCGLSTKKTWGERNMDGSHGVSTEGMHPAILLTYSSQMVVSPYLQHISKLRLFLSRGTQIPLPVYWKQYVIFCMGYRSKPSLRRLLTTVSLGSTFLSLSSVHSVHDNSNETVFGATGLPELPLLEENLPKAFEEAA